MVRPRHEARDRYHERFRAKRIQRRIEWLRRFARWLREVTTRRWRELESEFRRRREMTELFIDIVRGRAKLWFVIKHLEVPKEYMSVVIDDKFLDLIPPEQRQMAMVVLREVAKARGITKAIMEKYPQLIAWLRRYIAKERPFPCRHDAFAIKITPITVKMLEGLKVTYYILRYTYAGSARADPYLGRSKPTDLYFSFIAWKKPQEELINAMFSAGEGYSKLTDYVNVPIDVVHNRYVRLRLRQVMMHPHLVKHYFAKEAGRLEMYNYYDHCSVYAMTWHYSKSWKLKETGNRFLWGSRPKRRIKDITYWYGMRF